LYKSPERTRQRQGHDFPSVLDYLRNAETGMEGNFNMVGDGIINNLPTDEDARKKSLLNRLESAKETAAEQDINQHTPVDGHEPPERGLH
jgi:hypothetical protein